MKTKEINRYSFVFGLALFFFVLLATPFRNFFFNSFLWATASVLLLSLIVLLLASWIKGKDANFFVNVNKISSNRTAWENAPTYLKSTSVLSSSFILLAALWGVSSVVWLFVFFFRAFLSW
jgi:hypothetical protein